MTQGLGSTASLSGLRRNVLAILEHDSLVRAFCQVADTAAMLASPAEAPPGRLRGMTFGIKDLIDTALMPTTYGSVLYADHLPAADADVVALVRAAGGWVLGKTVTTEFAVMTPGPTRNPRRSTHTPGGSSSGSAAGVAAGMIDVGIGTQTYGSLIRPASFCGVFALKPTYGSVSTRGLWPLSSSFDTVGWMARTLGHLECVLFELVGPPAEPDTAPIGLRIGAVHTGSATDLAQAIRSLPGVRAVADQVMTADVSPVTIKAALQQVAHWHGVVAEYEIGRSLAGENGKPRPGLSAPLHDFVGRGLAIHEDHYSFARTELARHRRAALDVFADVDLVLAPSAPGEAPRGLEYTGDPRYCVPWTALGAPALNVPAATGATGLPIGVQLVAPPGRDHHLVRAAKALFPGLSASCSVGG